MLKKTGRDDRSHRQPLDMTGDDDAPDYFEDDDDIRPVVTSVDRPAATVAPSVARSESTVDAHSRFDGHYETDQDLRIFGTIAGEVVCRGTLTVERDAVAKARIEARDAFILGRVDGELVCTGKLVLTATAVVVGTVKAPTLVVEEGASLTGNVETAGSNAARPATPPPAVRVAPEPVDSAIAAEPLERQVAAPIRNTRRDLPSFAIVSSEERASLGRR